MPRALALKEPEPLLTLIQGTSLPTLGSNTRGMCLQKQRERGVTRRSDANK